MTEQRDLIDPLLDSRLKGYPHTQAPRRRSEIASAGWNVLDGNCRCRWRCSSARRSSTTSRGCSARARGWGIDLAPHGKTTMSPQLFRRQLDAGAWGLTFATVNQLAVGVAAGARRTLIANQVVADADLAGIQALLLAASGPAHRVPGRFAGAGRPDRSLVAAHSLAACRSR